MKKIAIFCDGTWNSPFIEVPTSVFLLSKACKLGSGQHIVYQAGVGTETGNVRLKIAKWAHKIGGGAFGWGLAKNVKLAYAEIAEVYAPGDEIFIFGFSRGAYTARSLAGMIRKCGIIPKEQLGSRRLAKAWKLYRKSGFENRPSADHIRKERLALSPVFCTDNEDLALRDGKGKMVNIAYLGVWDTVGALGIPESLLGPVAKWWNRRYKFHDMELSSLVKSARHAVALDERRVFYKPALWDNLDTPKNGKKPLNGNDVSENRPYQQLWFVGTHGVIGGSNEERRLVAYPLAWIAEPALSLGLNLKDGAHVPDVQPDVAVDTDAINSPGLPSNLLEWRDGPETINYCHGSVVERFNHDGLNYRPLSLENVMADLPVQHQPSQSVQFA